MAKKKKWPWHVIYGKDLMRLLQKAHGGEAPGLLYLELYANGEPDSGKKSYEPDPKPVKKPKKGKNK